MKERKKNWDETEKTATTTYTLHLGNDVEI